MDDSEDGYTVNNNTLRYNAMQMNVQRRLNRGLQMGLAYTLAKGVGWTGYNPDYLEADPTGALNELRLWGPTANDRTHNLVINYSYMVPNPTPDAPCEVDPGRLDGVRRHEVPERDGHAAQVHAPTTPVSPTRTRR